MLKYLGQRIVSAIIASLLFSAILFFSVNWLIPGDYVDTLALKLTGTENRHNLRQELRLDDSLGEQYARVTD